MTTANKPALPDGVLHDTPAGLMPRWSEQQVRAYGQSCYDAALAAKPAAQPAPSDLHSAIMNLPAKFPGLWDANEQRCYRIGHKDARHAAAELVAATEASRAQVVAGDSVDGMRPLDDVAHKVDKRVREIVDGFIVEQFCGTHSLVLEILRVDFRLSHGDKKGGLTIVVNGPAARQAKPLSEATRQNIDLVLSRLDQLHQSMVPCETRLLVDEAMACARAVEVAILASQEKSQ